MSIRSKIQSLITAANAKTGESDTTLTDAVQTLVDGYGQGGGSGSGLSVLASGTYTLAEGTKTLQIPVTAPITGTPKEAYIYRDDTITGTESLTAFVLLDAPTEVTYDGKYFKGNAGFVERYGNATISNPPTKTILSPTGSNGFSDGVLSATTSGANFKAGRYVWAIYGEASGGGGSSITVEPLTVTQNGTTTAPSGKAYSPVTVNVPQPSGTENIAANGQYDVSTYAGANVNVQPSAVWINFGSEGGTATLANPFPGLDYNDLATEFVPGNGRLEAFIAFEISGIRAAFHPLSDGNNIVGMAFLPDGGDGNPIGGYALWTNLGTLSTLMIYAGGQMRDLTAMAANIPCDVMIYGTTAPPPAT